MLVEGVGQREGKGSERRRGGVDTTDGKAQGKKKRGSYKRAAEEKATDDDVVAGPRRKKGKTRTSIHVAEGTRSAKGGGSEKDSN